MIFIDAPVFVSQSVYESAIRKLCTWADGQDGIVSVYQIGSVSTPGISDLDIVFVLADGAACEYDPLEVLTTEELYLFAHRPFAIHVGDIEGLRSFSMHFAWKHIGGDRLAEAESVVSVSENDQAILKTQVALEYLLKNYISYSVQKAYRIIKVRAVLLEAKAVAMDREYLGLPHAENHADAEIIALRESWFSLSDKEKRTLPRLFERLITEIESLISHGLSLNGFTVPEATAYQYSRNILLRDGDTLSVKRTGIILPVANRFGRKGFGLLNRTNRFEISLPMKKAEKRGILLNRAEQDIQIYRRAVKSFPYAGPITSGIYAHLWSKVR